MDWYVIHSKPREEQRALLNLERLGYECYLPMCFIEKVSRQALTVIEEPLFPRYFFIRLESHALGKSWIPIRSTRGVSALLTFGLEPAKVDNQLIEILKIQNKKIITEPKKLFVAGEQVQVTEGPFSGLNAIFQMNEGINRVVVLIELLNKTVRLSISPASLQKFN